MMPNKITPSLLLGLIFCNLAFVSFAQTLSQNVTFLKDKIQLTIPQDWQVSTQKIQNTDFYLYTSPDHTASFAITTFEYQNDSKLVLEEFLKNIKIQIPDCIFKKIENNTLKTHRVKGKTANLEIQIATIHQNNQVLLTYTLSTIKTNHHQILDKTVEAVCLL
jgi:hypothetical protein